MNNAKSGKLKYVRKSNAKNLKTTHVENMPNDQKMRYEIFQQLQFLTHNQGIDNWQELEKQLLDKGIKMQFYEKDNNVIGISFEKNEFKFSGVKIDKSCSFGELNKLLIQNSQNYKVIQKSVGSKKTIQQNAEPIKPSSNQIHSPKQNLAINRTLDLDDEEEAKKKRGMRR